MKLCQEVGCILALMEAETQFNQLGAFKVSAITLNSKFAASSMYSAYWLDKPVCSVT